MPPAREPVCSAGAQVLAVYARVPVLAHAVALVVALAATVPDALAAVVLAHRPRPLSLADAVPGAEQPGVALAMPIAHDVVEARALAHADAVDTADVVAPLP